MRLAALAALLALPAFACSAESGAASSAADVVVHPSGPGGDSTVTLTIPANTWPAHFYFGPSRTELQPNVATSVPYAPGADGKTPLQIQVGTAEGQILEATANVDIQPGANTIALGAMRLIHDAPSANAIITLDAVSPSGFLTYATAAGPVAVWTQNGNGQPPPSSVYEAQPIVPTFPGHYEFEPSATSIDVVAGQLTEAPMAEPSYFSQVYLEPDPTPAQFPSAFVGQQLDVNCAHGAPPMTPGSTLVGLQLTVGIYATTLAGCSWGYGTAREAFTLQPGASKILHAHNLDVDDVDLTDLPGQKVSGVVAVTLVDGTQVAQMWTKSSIALPPGTYVVTTTYAGPDGFAHSTSNTITL